MAYTELTCDDEGLTLQDLYRGSLRQMPDGTWAQQVVVVSGEVMGDFNNDFNNDFF